MKPPIGGGGLDSVSSPAPGNTLPRTFVVSGTYDGVTLPSVNYFVDEDNQRPDVTNQATDISGYPGVWRCGFNNVSPTNGARGKITVGNIEVANLTVKDDAEIIVLNPEPCDTSSSSIVVNGTFNPNIIQTITVDFSVVSNGPIMTPLPEPGAINYPTAGAFNCSINNIPQGSHYYIDVNGVENNTTVRVGELNITAP